MDALLRDLLRAKVTFQLRAIETVIRGDERHAWLKPAAKQVRKWRAEDEAKGEPWA